MVLLSPKLGKIDYTDKEILTIREGFFGFDNLKKYILINGGVDTMFSYLQNIEDPTITFIIANPKELIKDYLLTVTEKDLKDIDINDSNRDQLEDFVIVTIPACIEDITVNLLGPILINCSTMRGKQVISLNPAYTTKHKILHELKRAAS